ncbi:MAG: hypothetical protein QS748_13625 [Candidatus Endonucleobacter bathymodioli]|uniref:Uncharacterized protein n=1 Tax=Candidatus Endonucleibacter bathymodioli TaxID=539814 RepID=A0AA90SNJ7_9GAMM|nr:hypothetical protein [Candidatus Endonucleobacter bathymodioli]
MTKIREVIFLPVISLTHSEKISIFYIGVNDFFSETPKLSRNDFSFPRSAWECILAVV